MARPGRRRGIGQKVQRCRRERQDKKVYLLADPDRKPLEMELSSTGDKLTVRLPDKATDEIDSVLCVEVD